MSFSLPNPTSPNTSDQLQSTPIRQNFQSIASALNAFDGSGITAGTVSEAALATSVNPRQRGTDAGLNYVVSGLTITGTSATVSVSAGVAYVNGYRVVFAGGTQSLTASSDNYIDFDQSGVLHTSAVTNSVASPAVFANSIRIGIVPTNAGNSVTSINQGSTLATAPVVSSTTLTVTDSNGVLIYPTAPAPGLIGYRQITAPLSTTSTSFVICTGLSASVIVPAGRRVKVFAYTEAIYNATGNRYSSLSIWDGGVGTGTQLQQYDSFTYTASVGQSAPITWIGSPSAGVKTYNLGARADSALGGTFNLAAAATNPAFISVEVL